MRKMLAVVCVVCAAAQTTAETRLTPLEFDPFPPPDWTVVEYNTERGRAATCIFLGTMLHEWMNADLKPGNSDAAALGVKTASDMLDLVEQVLDVVDEHCGARPGK